MPPTVARSLQFPTDSRRSRSTVNGPAAHWRRGAREACHQKSRALAPRRGLRHSPFDDKSISAVVHYLGRCSHGCRNDRNSAGKRVKNGHREIFRERDNKTAVLSIILFTPARQAKRSEQAASGTASLTDEAHARAVARQTCLRSFLSLDNFVRAGRALRISDITF